MTEVNSDTNGDLAEVTLKTGKTVLTWKELFSRCEEYRHNKKVKDNDAVVLLTDFDNEGNWFSSWDPGGGRNFFIQTSRWDKLVDAEVMLSGAVRAGNNFAVFIGLRISGGTERNGSFRTKRLSF